MRFELQLQLSVRKILNNSFYKDSFWALLGSVSGKGLSLLAGIIVARFLGKEIYGEYGMIKTTFLYLTIFSTLGLGYSSTRFIAKYLEEDQDIVKSIIKCVYYITLLVSFTLAISVMIFAPYIANYLKAPHLFITLRWCAVAIIFNAINTSQIGILSGFKAFKSVAINNTIAGIITFVLSVTLTYFYGLDGAVFALLISFVCNCLLNYNSIRGILSNFNNSIKRWRVLIKKLIVFSLPIALQESLYTIIHWVNILLLVKYSSYGEVALFTVVSQWIGVVVFLPAVLKNVILSHLSSNNTSMKLMLTVNFFSTLIPLIIIIAFSNSICQFYGESFQDLKNVLIVGVLSAIFICISDVYNSKLISLGKTWKVFIFRFIRDVSILIFVYALFNDDTYTNGAYLLVLLTTISSVLYFVVLCIDYYISVKYISPKGYA